MTTLPTQSSDAGPLSAAYCPNCGASTRAVTLGECNECGSDCCDACGHFVGSVGRAARTILHCKSCGPDWFRCADCGSTKATVSADRKLRAGSVCCAEEPARIAPRAELAVIGNGLYFPTRRRR